MTKYSVVEDVSSLTTIPRTSLNSLIDKAIYSICDCVEETILVSGSNLEIDIGIGTLKIGIEDEIVKYRFIPSAKLEDGVTDTIVNHKNPLVCKIEENLVKKILKTYKDFV